MPDETPSEFLQPEYTFDKLKPYDQIFVQQMLIHGIPSKASLAAGMHRHYGAWILKARPEVAAVYEQMKLDRSRRVNVTADMVLTGLYDQLGRLMTMLDCSIADILWPDGSVKPISEWPEIWQTRMIEGFEVAELSQRSHDGQTEGKDGGWDEAGVVKKIKRTSQIEVEKQIRECWKLIGAHVNVKAFPVPGEKLGEGVQNLADAINAGIAAGRQRAAKRNAIGE